jgi:hypothetical protein
MTDLNERVAIVETRLESIEATLNTHFTEDEERMDKITIKLEELSQQLNASKSFIGGVVFILSCIWAVFLTFKETIFNHVSK